MVPLFMTSSPATEIAAAPGALMVRVPVLVIGL
jgi:hypothetical protein